MKKNIFNYVLLGMMVTTIFSCSLLGPDYTKPKIATPQNWSSLKNQQSSTMQIESAALADTAWWKKFNDPALNDMINQALLNNNDIQVAIGNIMAAKARLQEAKMLWIPTIGVGGGGFVGQSFNQAITSNNPSLSGISQNSTSFYGDFGGFVPAYSLNIFQTIKNQEMAKLNVKLQQAVKNAVRLAVASQVAGSYFTLLGLQKQLMLQEQMVIDAVSLRKYVEVQFNNGTASQMNLDVLDQVIANLNSSIPNIEENIVITENALQVLMDKNPGKIMCINDFNHIKTDGIIPINLPSTVLKARPDIIAAEYEVEVSNTKIGVSMSAFFPTISLTNPVGATSFQLSNLFSGGTDFWMTQIAATMPLLNMAMYSEIDQTKAGYYAAYYNYIKVVRSAFADVDNGLSKHQSADKIYLERQKELSAADNLYQLSQVSYKEGATSYANTIGVKLNRDSLELNINQAKMNQLNAIVNLYQALGGGYNVHNNEAAKKFNDAHDI